MHSPNVSSLEHPKMETDVVDVEKGKEMLRCSPVDKHLKNGP